ncbi:MAG: twin-arginine translocation signal domain-containing protein [Phycisphaerales bacterium]|nr:MAG: twin-arginine translocation signal domain-containing protein [Phycisphaerales bacterium]
MRHRKGRLKKFNKTSRRQFLKTISLGVAAPGTYLRRYFSCW